MKVYRPLFFVISLILIVGMACSFGSSAVPTVAPTVEVVLPTDEVIPTEEAEPTEEVLPTDEPMQTDTPEANVSNDYFTDTFDADTLSNYTVENRKKGADTDKMKVNIKNSALVFDLTGINLWVYVTYKPFKYTDVKITIKTDNRGKNNNNVTLYCRQSDEGWYEFSIANNGLYWIYAYDATGVIAKGYNNIFNGGSTAIKQGKDSNVYEASCVGDKLSLSINGTEVKTIRDTKFKFREGTIGFGVSSFNVTPILVNVNEFTVSQP